MANKNHSCTKKEKSCEILFGKTKKNKTCFLYLKTFFLIILEKMISIRHMYIYLPFSLLLKWENCPCSIQSQPWHPCSGAQFLLLTRKAFFFFFPSQENFTLLSLLIPSFRLSHFSPQPTPFQLSSPLGL